jgi:hypothetical protein
LVRRTARRRRDLAQQWRHGARSRKKEKRRRRRPADGPSQS